MTTQSLKKYTYAHTYKMPLPCLGDVCSCRHKDVSFSVLEFLELQNICMYVMITVPTLYDHSEDFKISYM